MSTRPKNRIVKVAILGDGACGKTSLIRAKQRKIFEEKNAITIGVDIQCIPFEYKKIQGDDATFLAVDLGGQKRFHFIHDCYITGIKLAVLMYDLSRYPTFLNLPKWYGLVQKEGALIPVLIVGTKKDLVSEERQNFYFAEFKRIRNLLPNPENIQGHYFISSKTCEGVDQLFLNCENLMKMAIQQ
ncbi:MAG: Rab family GTPase [Promethearchaeota archaeon]